ncbi:Uncharacterised protein [Legionella busanensis]|uniref:Uncharacterized protein n=1 Tax=Legionella busanensis TaxID=190655 RepID=A0A378JRP8_9GAMM|nr:hypothetical protein [Legionella busanensis]STX52560.1 Uncharacterised protein [Legionella busanensis]
MITNNTINTYFSQSKSVFKFIKFHYCALRKAESLGAKTAIGCGFFNQPEETKKFFCSYRVIVGGLRLVVYDNVPEAGRARINTSRIGESI